jgi:hypothetical protein
MAAIAHTILIDIPTRGHDICSVAAPQNSTLVAKVPEDDGKKFTKTLQQLAKSLRNVVDNSTFRRRRSNAGFIFQLIHSFRSGI